jgi:hypothetical protein
VTNGVITQSLLSSLSDCCSAVFSYWTSTLDAIEQALAPAGIMFARYDGRMTKIKRDSTLFTFAQNTAVKVILVSITCGGQGYVSTGFVGPHQTHSVFLGLI